MIEDIHTLLLEGHIKLQFQIDHLARKAGLSEKELDQMWADAAVQTEAEFLALRHRMGDL